MEASQNSNRGMSVFGVTMACIVTAAASIGASYVLQKKAGGQTHARVITLDSERIIEAKARTFGMAATKQEAMKQAEVFTKQLKAQVQYYSDQGYIVVNKRAVIGSQPQFDVTTAVAAAMKVTLDANQ